MGEPRRRLDANAFAFAAWRKRGYPAPATRPRYPAPLPGRPRYPAGLAAAGSTHLTTAGYSLATASPLRSRAAVNRARLCRRPHVARSSTACPLDVATRHPLTRPSAFTLSTTDVRPSNSYRRAAAG